MFAKPESDAAPIRRVLVVDDEPSLRELMQRILESSGYEARCFPSCRSALIEFLRRGPFDVVVTDVFMPRHSGFELIAKLRRHYPRTKVLAVSGGDMAAPPLDFPGAASVRPDAVLPKPFNRQQLLAAVDSLAAPALV